MTKLMVSLLQTVMDDPTLDDVIDSLNKFRGSSDQLEMERFDAPVPGPKALHVESDNGLYRPALTMRDDDGRGYILCYKNPKADDSWVYLGPYEYPTELLTDDFDLIVSMVKEFYETGTVKALNHIYDFSKSDRV